MQVWICLQLENISERNGYNQQKKCALPCLENSSERKVHCHIWTISVKKCAQPHLENISKRIVHSYMYRIQAKEMYTATSQYFPVTDFTH